MLLRLDWLVYAIYLIYTIKRNYIKVTGAGSDSIKRFKYAWFVWWFASINLADFLVKHNNEIASILHVLVTDKLPSIERTTPYHFKSTQLIVLYSY